MIVCVLHYMHAYAVVLVIDLCNHVITPDYISVPWSGHSGCDCTVRTRDYIFAKISLLPRAMA